MQWGRLRGVSLFVCRVRNLERSTRGTGLRDGASHKNVHKRQKTVGVRARVRGEGVR